MTLIWLLTLRVLFFLVSTKRNFFFQNKIGSGWKKCGCLVGTSKSSTKPKKNDVFVLCVKTQRRSCRVFGIFWKVSPLLTGLSSKCHNFFLYLVSVEFGKVCLTKVFTLSVFQKNFEFVCFPPFLLSFSKKIECFLPKITCIGGKQTNYKKNLNEKFECFRCFFIRWLY